MFFSATNVFLSNGGAQQHGLYTLGVHPHMVHTPPVMTVIQSKTSNLALHGGTDITYP